MTYPCAFCDEHGTIERFFSCPTELWRPNMYTVCEKHKDNYLTWDDVYPYENCKPVTRHEDKAIE